MGIVEETQVRFMVKGMVITDFWRILLSYFIFCLRKILTPISICKCYTQKISYLTLNFFFPLYFSQAIKLYCYIIFQMTSCLKFKNFVYLFLKYPYSFSIPTILRDEI